MYQLQAESETSEYRLRVASEDFRNGRLAEATDEASALWALGWRDARLAVLYGELSLLSNRLEEAEPALRIASAAQPQNRHLIHLLAELCRRAGRMYEAVGFYARAGRTPLASRCSSLALDGIYGFPRGQRAFSIDWIEVTPLPTVAARIGGSEFHFLLDTGVGETLIDPVVARRGAAESFGHEELQFPAGVGGIVEHAILPRIELAGVPINHVPVQIHPLRHAFTAIGDKRVDGIFGTGLFSRFRTTLDYGRQSMTLAPGASVSGSGSGQDDSVPFYWTHEQYLLVRARINARLDTLLFLNTGMTGAEISLLTSVAHLAGAQLQDTERVPTFGLPAGITAIPMSCDAVEAGGVHRENVRGVALERMRFARSLGFRLGGLMGGSYLLGGQLVLDFSQMRLAVRDGGG